MTLFFVGVVEMIIAAFWTKAVSKENAPLTGLITMANIFIWFYVIRVVIDNLGDWTTIVPYAFGCALGSMIGAVAGKATVRKKRPANGRAAKGRTPSRRLTVEEAAVLSTDTYESL